MRDLDRIARTITRADALHLMVTRLALDAVRSIASGERTIVGERPFLSYDSSHPWCCGIRTECGWAILWKQNGFYEVFSVSCSQPGRGAAVVAERSRPWCRPSPPDDVELLFCEMDRLIRTAKDIPILEHIHKEDREYEAWMDGQNIY